MAERQLTTLWGTSTLDLFPKDPQSTLRAWDAADELLLNHLKEVQPDPKGPVLLVNDQYGSLNCALKGIQCHHFNDSSISEQAIAQNLTQNEIDQKITKTEDMIYGIILIKVPKTLSLLEYQLSVLSKKMDKNTLIIAAAMTRHIHNSTLQLFEEWIGPTQTSLAKKKARLIFSSFEAQMDRPEFIMEQSYSVPGIPEPVANLPHLFSRDHLDRGTALFLESLRPVNEKNIHVADYGCGNGIIGIYTALHNSGVTVTALDESELAIQCAEINRDRNGLQSRMTLVQGSSLKELTGPFQLIYSNPPFHQGQKIDLAPTLQFFQEAHEMLEQDGEFRIVCNRHLGYHKHIESIFGNCKTIREKEGFLILTAKKI